MSRKPPPGTTMLYRLESDVVLTVHADVAPSDPDWNAYVDWLTRSRASIRSILVRTEDAGPNLEQRKRISAIEGASRVPTAVVTPSLQARGMATALSWLGLKIRAFKPTDLDAAFAFLGVPENERSKVLDRIASFRAELAGADLEELLDELPTTAARESARQAVIHERLERVRTRVRERQKTRKDGNS